MKLMERKGVAKFVGSAFIISCVVLVMFLFVAIVDLVVLGRGPRWHDFVPGWPRVGATFLAILICSGIRYLWIHRGSRHPVDSN